MKPLKVVISSIKQYYLDSNLYQTECIDEITLINLFLLRKLSAISAVFMTLYTLFPLHKNQPFILYLIYGAFILIHVGFMCFISYYSKKSRYNPHTVIKVCILFLCSVFNFATILDLFSNPSSPSILLPLILVTFPSLMIILPWKSISIALFFGSIFMFVSHRIKPHDVFLLDRYSILSAWVFMIIFSLMIYGLRLQDCKSKLKLKFLSAIDELTGLSNKATTEYLCRSYFENKPKETPCVLLIVDLDNFKWVNDTLGHQQGDVVLSKVGHSLRTLFRGGDIVGRIGGDEFVIVMKNTSDRNIIAMKAKQICLQVNAIFADQTTSSVSCSIGIAISPSAGISYEKLFSYSDKALYEAKKAGKDQFVIYSGNSKKSLSSGKPLMLIADDAAVSRSILINAFEHEYSFLEAENGVQAIDLLHKFSEEITVVLLNIVMPEKDGYDVLEEMASEPSLRSIPALAITSDSANELKALELGAVDLIIKPFDPTVVKKRVANARARKK
ncbi:MAG: diguanylate cyclase [Lachnospiraceae bacterium]|nr:diguanylate cyclase [Lachnospiraceae bacterium]